MEGESLYPSSLLVIGKMLKCLPATKPYFSKCETEECPSLIWKYIRIRTKKGVTGKWKFFCCSSKTST